MTSRDGIGAPRRLDTIAREEAVLAEARRLARAELRGLRHEDALRVLPQGTTRKQVNYTLERLARDGHLVRRDGYAWHPVAG